MNQEFEKKPAGFQKISVPEINTPKGGGAMRGIGDSYRPSFFTGTGSCSIPFPLTKGRGLDPQVSLDYNSGFGNGAFGLGFSLSLPKISVRTDKRIPLYNDKDIYIYTPAGELIRKDATPVRYETESGDTFRVVTYLPIVESLYSNIEQWISNATGLSFWKVVSADNITTFFGRDDSSRIYNPDDQVQIFEWLIDGTLDARGNKIEYSYKCENDQGVAKEIFEVNRSYSANRYISTIRYGNYFDANGQEKFAFKVIFDYGEYDLQDIPVREWACRPDPFSSYKSGFEIRTFRLCRNILLFHSFEAELGDPCLVKALGIEYTNLQLYDPVSVAGLSLPCRIEITGYRKIDEGHSIQESMPPFVLTYSAFNLPVDPGFKTLSVADGMLPGFLNAGQLQQVDLYGDGLPGVLYSNREQVLYMAPEGDGKYSMPESVGMFPTDRGLQSEGMTLTDIDGNGELQLVVNSQGKAGYYQNTGGESWNDFIPFPRYPTNFDNVKESVDLDADGKTDLIQTGREDLTVYFSEGKEGYRSGQRIPVEPGFPLSMGDYRQGLVTWANMFGDGLSHRVKICNGSVECWPCLGYGRFDKKVTFANAPSFGDQFDSRRVFLADIDGSGTVDLVYVYADRVEVFLNQSGNSFADAITVRLPDTFSDIDQILFSDLLGNGTNCLVFTKIASAPVHYYYNFAGETLLPDGGLMPVMKPYLLCRIDNNMGAVTQIRYCSSTKFALEDKLAGRPWATRLRFPVQVVEKTIVEDRIADSCFVNRYKYHDGYFDPVAREFRGFGYVESWDAEEYGTNIELHVPPVYTRQWFHTGAYLSSARISKQYQEEYFHGDAEAYEMPDSIMDETCYEETDTLRQAYAALKGRLLRKETYGEDGSILADNPYAVEESNFAIRLVQAKGKQEYAVFRVDPREGISYHYERNPVDPRVEQNFVFEVDTSSGKPRSSCVVSLPRRIVPGATIYPKQLALKCMLTLTDYINSGAESAYWWRGVPYQEQQLEICGLQLQGSGYFSFEVIQPQVKTAQATVLPYGQDPTPGVLEAIQLCWNRSYFWDEAQQAPLPLGKIASRGLLYNSGAAVFTKAFIEKVFGDKLTDAMIGEEGGYLFDSVTGYWWNQGLVQHYFLPDQPEYFFLLKKTENSFVAEASRLFQKKELDYNSPYNILPVVMRSYLDDTVVNTETYTVEYQSLQYNQVIDINGNVQQLLFDPLSRVVVSSLFGVENDKHTGGMRLYAYDGEPAEYVERFTNPTGGPITFEDVLANREYYLQGAASFFYYRLRAWAEDGQPAGAINLLRNTFYYVEETLTDFSCQAFIEYSDGLGQSVEKKQAGGDYQWIVSGKTVYDNKGNICQEYLPFFSDTPYYESQDVTLGPPPAIIHYDPLSRVVRIDTPKGFFSKVDYSPWEESHYDEDDTVIDSPFYKEYYPNGLTPDEKDAIDKAKVFFDTPTIKVFTNTGFDFLEIQTLPEGGRLVGYKDLDIQGRVLRVADARLYASNTTKGTSYYNFEYMYVMGDKKPLYTDSADAGLNRVFSNIYGNACLTWSPLDYCEHVVYDRLQRRVEVRVDSDLAESFIYGEEQADTGNNLRGQVTTIKDQSGVVVNSSYGLTKKLLLTSRQMVVEYTASINWSQSVLLEDQLYETGFSYDALDRLLTETTPDGSIVVNTYNPAGLLYTVSVTDSGGTVRSVVSEIQYNSRSQRIKLVYGNGIGTSYTYEDKTLRLIKLLSSRPGGGTDATVQHITYTYDPVGNLTRLWDYSYETVFSKNQQVDPLSDYTYDAIYRLLIASGRQHPGINANTYKNNIKDGSFKQSIFSELPDINDSDKLENYRELYTYDDSNNCISKQHIAPSVSYTVDAAVEDDSNRLKEVAYDAAGNQVQLDINNQVPLGYNFFNNLVKAGIIERPDEPDDSDYYLYDSSQVRSRRIVERMVHGATTTQIDETTYLGHYEIRRQKTVDTEGHVTLQLERQTLRVMDSTTCLLIMHYWPMDKLQREVDEVGTRSERFQMGNHLGSVSLEMDADAKLISYEEYFPFGGTAIIAGENQQEVALKDYRYMGKECDDSTGLYYYGARYYLSWLGRWNKPDPAGTGDGLNLYSFVKNNPVKFVDETGNISLLGTKIAINVASLFLFIAGPIAGAAGGAVSGWKAFNNPVAKVAGAVAGALGGFAVGAVLGAINTVLTPIRWIYEGVLHQVRKGPAAPAGTYAGVLYNPSQRTDIFGLIPMDSGRSGAEMIAEQQGIPRALWPTLVRPFNDPALGTLTGSANFNGRLMMVGHGNWNGQLETVGTHGVPGRELLEGADSVLMFDGTQQMLAGRGLNWANVNAIDMSICMADNPLALSPTHGTTYAGGLQQELGAGGAGPDITIRASAQSVSPVGNLHAMGLIREGSFGFGEVLHWLSFGLYTPNAIGNAPAAGLRNTNTAVAGNNWHTLRT